MTQLNRRDRIAAIRADLAAKLDAGDFGDQLYTCALGHDWLLWLYVGTLLRLADQFERWTPAEKADHASALAYVARELERVWITRSPAECDLHDATRL